MCWKAVAKIVLRQNKFDSDELSAMSMRSESADDEDFFGCSDQEWEGHHDLPAQTAQQPSKPPLLYQSSVELKMSTPSLYPRQSLNYVDFKANDWGPPSVPTDTNVKLLGDQVATNSESPS